MDENIETIETLSQEFYNKHYINIDLRGNITYGWSDGPQTMKEPTEDDICINEQGGYQFRLFPDGEENPVLFTMMGIPLYHYNRVTGEITLRSEEEIAEDTANIPPPPPDRLSKVEADQAYIAAMLDIDLDE